MYLVLFLSLSLSLYYMMTCVCVPWCSVSTAHILQYIYVYVADVLMEWMVFVYRTQHRNSAHVVIIFMLECIDIKRRHIYRKSKKNEQNSSPVWWPARIVPCICARLKLKNKLIGPTIICEKKKKTRRWYEKKSISNIKKCESTAGCRT